MTSLKAALERAGFVSAKAEATPEKARETPEKREEPTSAPCEDDTGARCAVLDAVLGKETAIALLSDTLQAPYGRVRRQADISRAMDARTAQMRTADLTMLRIQYGDRALDWTFGRASDLDYTMQSCLDAFTEGGYHAWVAIRTQAAAAPRWPQPPALPEALERNDVSALVTVYIQQLDAWEGERTPVELRVLGWDYSKRTQAIRDYENSLVALAKETYAAKFIDVGNQARKAYEAGELSVEGALELIGWGYPDRTAFEESLRSSRAGWLRGDGPLDVPSGCTLEELTLEALERRVQRFREASDKGTQKRLLALVRSGQGYLLPAREGSRKCITPEGYLQLQGSVPLASGAVSLAPAPSGWVDVQSKQWCGPEVYEALHRLLQHRRGNLDISRVMSLYGRHETANWPRLLASAWKHKVVIGIDDRLGQHFDDLVLLSRTAKGEIPADAWWISARIRKTANEKLRIEAGTGPVGSLVAHHSGTMSRGRHGIEGRLDSLASTNTALAVEAAGGSGGGGQMRIVVVGLVTAETPLLLDSGAGFQFKEGSTFYVPGLTKGLPGTPQPV